MIMLLADKVTDYLFRKEIIIEDFEIYRHGIALYISECLNFGSLLLISLCTGHTFYTVVYFFLFTKMRVTFGGFHCKSFFNCYITYIGIYLLFEMQLHIMIPLFIQVISFIPCMMIWKLAPVEHVKKKLTYEIRNTACKKAKMMTVFVIIIFLMMTHWRNLSITIWYCVCANTVLMILGKGNEVDISKDY